MYDVETGLYYLRARYYNPNWQRFVNVDYIIKGNLFEYCNNNSISYIDPSGNLPGAWTDDEEDVSFATMDNPPPCFIPKPIPGIELMTKKDLADNFIIGNEYIVPLTDLITGTTFKIEWKPKDYYHTDFWFHGETAKRLARNCLRSYPEEKKHWDVPESWSKNARPGMIVVTDKHGLERKIAVGFVLFPHDKEYSHFTEKGEMCMFYGDDTEGSAKERGNEAAINAYHGYYHEVIRE